LEISVALRVDIDAFELGKRSAVRFALLPERIA
jgi:hypothetical protein